MAGAILATLLLPLVPVLLVARHIYSDRSDLPDIAPFIRFDLPATGEIYDSRGDVLISVAREYRRVISFDEVPVVIRQAILATEDKRFFSHSGVDYGVLPRVLEKTVEGSLASWWHGGGIQLKLFQGGSTLTQQLVRGYFMSTRTDREDGQVLVDGGLGPRLMSLVVGTPVTNKLLRKVEEMRLALWLEREMVRRYGTRDAAKREIFSRYASFIYMGHGRYGFAAASEYYFGRKLSSYGEEDAGQAALLAGISKSPRDYAPVAGAANPLRRRNEVLALMVNAGYIPADLAARATAEPVRVVTPSAVKTHASAAIGTVLEELERYGDRFGPEDLFAGRLSVRTTVDMRVQAIVSEALEAGLAAYERRHPRATGSTQGSVVVLRNRDAAILGEAGGRETYRDRRGTYSDFNRVTDAMRQPGSAWKPIVYLAAFRHGLTLDAIVPDEPISVIGSEPDDVKWIGNYDRQFKGPIPARRALAESRNAAAIWIAQEVGLDEVINTARDLGIHSPLHRYPSMALGSLEVRLLELAGAYRAMASGIRAEPYVIAEVMDDSGVSLYQVARRRSAMDTSGLQAIQEGLRGVVRIEGGTAHALDGNGFPIAVMGKTGTTDDFRDAVFVGSTYGVDGITVAVRIGFDDNRSLGDQETGARAALPVFREIMLRIYGDDLVGPAPLFPRVIEDGIDSYRSPPPADFTEPLPYVLVE